MVTLRPLNRRNAWPPWGQTSSALRGRLGGGVDFYGPGRSVGSVTIGGPKEGARVYILDEFLQAGGNDGGCNGSRAFVMFWFFFTCP